MAETVCNDNGSPVAVNPLGNASAQSSRALTKRVKCAGVDAWSTSSSGMAVVWVVGVSSASTSPSAAANSRFASSRSLSALR
jgi:hypothetical protein